MTNRIGTRWRGKLAIPERAHPLMQAFFRAVNAQQATLTEVADSAELQRGTISDWRYRREPSLSTFDRTLRALGLKLAIVPLDALEAPPFRACAHRDLEERATHLRCRACGGVYPDEAWGIAKNRWFRDLGEAQFYRAHARFPEE